MFAPGEILENKYRIVRLIGEGGMGSVFEAEAMRLHRRVAIKVLHAGSAGEGEAAARFQLEAQAAGRIGSRHIVEVIDLGQLPSAAHYMVMEFLEGQSLRERIAARGPMTARQLYPIAEQLITGVAAAHAAGIIHRDLKPDNVFLVRQPDGKDFVKILDFGISKFGSTQAGAQGKELSLTRTGALMGTPFYLSPEQANGSKGIDQRTDLYTLGVILYECIAGVVPHAADTFNQLLFSIVLEPPPPISDRVPSADPNFVAIIERAMAKEPKLRFQSADEMNQALLAWAQGAPLSLSLGPAPSSQLAANSARAPNSAGPNGGAASPSVISARQRATLASEGVSHTVDPWSQSKASNLALSDDEPSVRPSKLPWVVAGFGALALFFVGGLLLKHSAAPDPSVEAPTAVTAVQIAPPEEPPPARLPAPVEPTLTPSANPLPPAAEVPDSAGDQRVAPTSPANRSSTKRAKAGVPSGAAATPPEPVPVAAPAPVAVPTPAPAPAPVAVPTPATTSDVSRTRGGRAIRGDL